MKASSNHPAAILSAFLCSLALGCLLLSSCNSGTEADKDFALDFNLSDSLKNYSQVLITVHDPNDLSVILDTVFLGKLLRPATLPTYVVPPAFGRDFMVRIQGYDVDGLLSLESHIAIADGKPQTPEKTPSETLPGWKPNPIDPVDTSPVDTTPVPILEDTASVGGATFSGNAEEPR